MANKIKFVLDGCDICLIAEAPEDITLKQLLAQTDKIYPNWCACGICSLERAGLPENTELEVSIGYDSVEAIGEAPCTIREKRKE